MQCARCHRELSDVAKFCPDCGLKIEKTGDVGAENAPAYSGLPGLPPLPSSPSSKKEVESEFVPVSFDNVTMPVNNMPDIRPQPAPAVFAPATQAYAPASPAYAQGQPVAAPVFQPNIAPVVLFPRNTYWEESDYYHIDATEVPDFEAIRGISIFLMVVSLLPVFGVLFPLPLCIVSLILSCLGAGEVDPVRAKKRFNVCRVLAIISIIAVVVLLILIYVLRYLANYTAFLDGSILKSSLKFVGSAFSLFM